MRLKQDKKVIATEKIRLTKSERFSDSLITTWEETVVIKPHDIEEDSDIVFDCGAKNYNITGAMYYLEFITSQGKSFLGKVNDEPPDA